MDIDTVLTIPNKYHYIVLLLQWTHKLGAQHYQVYNKLWYIENYSKPWVLLDVFTQYNFFLGISLIHRRWSTYPIVWIKMEGNILKSKHQAPGSRWHLLTMHIQKVCNELGKFIEIRRWNKKLTCKRQYNEIIEIQLYQHYCKHKQFDCKTHYSTM